MSNTDAYHYSITRSRSGKAFFKKNFEQIRLAITKLTLLTKVISCFLLLLSTLGSY